MRGNSDARARIQELKSSQLTKLKEKICYLNFWRNSYWIFNIKTQVHFRVQVSFGIVVQVGRHHAASVFDELGMRLKHQTWTFKFRLSFHFFLSHTFLLLPSVSSHPEHLFCAGVRPASITTPGRD